MCWEDSSRPLWALGAALVVVVTLAVPVWLILRARGDRGAALAVWAAGLPLLPAILWLDAEGDEPLGTEWAVALGVGIGALIGLGVGVARRRPSFVVLGALGGAGLVAAAGALFVGLLAITGTCLD
jgi:hypothetical protein